MKNLKIFLQLIAVSVVVVFVVMGAQAVFAAGPLDASLGSLNTAVKGTNLSDNLGNSVGDVVKGLLSVVGTLFLILSIYAGMLWMLAQGNEEQVSKAKGIIQTAVIGLFITMSAYAITTFVAARVGGDTGAYSGGVSGPATAGQLSDDDCKNQAATCDYLPNVGANCNSGIYTGQSVGACTSVGGTQRICCILKDSADKCARVGGVCRDGNKCGGDPVFPVNAGFTCGGLFPQVCCVSE